MRMAALALACLVMSAPPAPARGEADGEESKRVDALFEQITGRMPGVAVLVLRDGKGARSRAGGDGRSVANKVRQHGKADPAAIGPEAIPEGASVPSGRRALAGRVALMVV
jgi:hypothetical protein